MPGSSVLDVLGANMVRWFPLHKWLFIGAQVFLTVLNVLVGSGWWAFWPLVVWGLPFTIHFLWYRSAEVDQEWVDERALDINLQSYDRSHIEAISVREEPGLWKPPAEPPKKR